MITEVQDNAVRKQRVVLLEDEPMLLEVFQWMWVNEPHLKDTILLAFTKPEEAMEEVTKRAPDVFVLDDTLPTPSAPDILATLSEHGVRYPILVMSSLFPERELREIAGKTLKLKILQKPFTKVGFIESLRLCLAQ